MLGIVFTEFMDMVEDKFSADMVEELIDESELTSGGTYTAVGNYSHEEIVALVVTLSQKSGVSVDELVRIFGKHLLSRFAELYPMFFENVDGPYEFLQLVDAYIHQEVMKLYPDASPPSVTAERAGSNDIIIHYESVHPFANLALGLLEGTMEHFGVDAEIDCEVIPTPNKNAAKFTIRMAAA